MINFDFQTPETDLGLPSRFKLAREIRVKVQGAGPNSGSLDATTGWLTKTAIPASKCAFASAYLNGVIYLFGGGATDTTLTNTVYAYTIATDSWTTKTAVPINVDHGQAIAFGDKIYLVASNFLGSGVNTKTYMFDPTGAGTWTLKADVWAAGEVFEHSLTSDGTYIYLTGGNGRAPIVGFTNPLNVCRRYDPATDTWTSLTGMPAARYAHSSQYYNGKIYVIGGSTGTPTVLNSMYVYTIATDSWVTAAAVLPAARMNMMTSVIGSMIYIFGGHSAYDATPTNTIYTYDTATSTMAVSSVTLPTATAWGGALNTGTAIYIEGGVSALTENITIGILTAVGGYPVGTVELYCDRKLKFSGTLTTDGMANYKVNRFRLPPSCRGESFYMKLYNSPNMTLQVYDAKISEFVVLPSGVVK